MSEQGGPYPPSGQGQHGQGWQPGQPTGPQGVQQPGPQGWQQPGQPQGPQGWQQPGQPQGPQGWQQPAQGQGPQGWQQPGQPQGPQGWQQPGQGQGPQGWQQPGQPTQGFPPAGGPGQQWTGQQPAATPSSGSSKTPLIITAIAVVVAIVAGVGIYFFAIRDSNDVASTGAKSPQESVTALFNTLSNSDPIGLADQLDPVEAALFTDLNTDIIGELKRLGVLDETASADSMTGTTISVAGLTFAGADETINDNLRIVQLTGGEITIASNPGNIPLSGKIKDAFGSEIDQTQPQSQTVNIADAVAKNDGQPIRVATVKRGDQWYVSLFYSIADNATHAAGLPNPTDADRIGNAEAKSPEDAVNQLIEQSTAGDLEGVIALLPPDEMGVMHDYGKLLIDEAGGSDLTSDMDSLGVKISDATWVVSDVTGGKKVSIGSMTVTADGQTATITRDADANSIKLEVEGEPTTIELDEDSIDSFLTDSVGSDELTPEMLKIIKQEFKQVIGLGVVTVEVDGNWYVSPIRSFSDVGVSLLKGLDSEDVDYLISLAKN